MINQKGIILRFRFFLLSLLLLGIGNSLSACIITDYFFGEVTPISPESTQALPSSGYEVPITFHVELPENTPPDQPILISILDEVTGLALNAKRFPIASDEDGEYFVKLSFPVGTTVKYRYSRRSLILAEEHISNGKAVRYRLYHVTGPGEVYDVISRWNDTNFEGLTGRISGSTFDVDTGEPIPGVLVTAGGAQAFTSGDGGFLIEGLPPGTHNLVVLAPDGSYLPFQQGAVVAPDSNTPATIQLKKTELVQITFRLTVPKDTPPAIPIRIAGNLWQLGNTFADLAGGISTLATRMPVLKPVQERVYELVVNLPAGSDLKYKYTLGDGFWNTERSKNGEWVVRQLIIPYKSTTVEDTLDTWSVGEQGPITFDISVPESTPVNEKVFIQFNPYGWTEPLPMWQLGEERWAYILYSPLELLNELGYRFCRAGQCGYADDARTPGAFTSGQIVQTSKEPKGLPDVIEAWTWWGFETDSQIDFSLVHVDEPQREGFHAGIEFQERFHPSWIPIISTTIEDVSSLNANWIVLTPTWSFTRDNPPTLEIVPGYDPLWMDTVEMIQAAKEKDLDVALKPVAQFPLPIEAWWLSAPRDFSWWVSWFDRYQEFILHHADLAEQNGVSHLILGGDWISPALPSGRLQNGDFSGIPPDADNRYRQLIEKVAERFSGRIGCTLAFPEEVANPPGFLDEVDFVYVIWDEALTTEINPSIAEMKEKAEKEISQVLFPFWQSLEESSDPIDIVLSMAYPSIDGAANECLADPHQDCILPSSLNYPAPDYPLLELDLGIQARVYYAMLAAISRHNWISGVVSRGYYPPALLQDKSTSVHGKPAEDVLRVWFEEFLKISE